MNALQRQLDECGGRLRLTPGEYEGPVQVTRPCEIDGSGATVWAAHGPVFRVASSGVTLKNLRVEVTEPGASNRTAIRAETRGVTLEGVTVNGDVENIPGEPSHWNLPLLIALGEFAAGTENMFSVVLSLAGPVELECTIHGMSISPARLPAGRHTVSLKMEALRDHTVLYGEILVKSRVIRHICVTGQARTGAPVRRGDLAPAPGGQEVNPPVVPMEALPPAAPDASIPYMAHGQRTGFPELEQGILKVALEYQGTRVPMELDSYLFLLQKNGKVRGDADFVFFGNPESRDHAVRLGTGGLQPLALASLSEVEPSVERIAVCYSIYGEEPSKNFSQVQEPLLRLFAGQRELCRMKLEHLSIERTLVAVEIYRHKGQWKVNFVASGYRDGLRRLCESYGVEVE